MVHSFSQSSMNVKKRKKNQLQTIHIYFKKQSHQLPQLLPTTSHCRASLVRSTLMATWLSSVCVCVCVFIFFHREGFFRLQDVQGILEGTNQIKSILCCEYQLGAFSQVPSSPYLKMSYFTSKDKNFSRQFGGEKTM